MVEMGQQNMTLGRPVAPGLFLDDAELQQLTARKFKSKQIEWLRAQCIPFRVSSTGHPVVTRLAVEGRGTAAEQLPQVSGWVPRVMGGAHGS